MNRLHIEVLRYSEAKELLLGIGQCSKSWHQASLDPELWDDLLTSDFGVATRKSAVQKYKRTWLQRHLLAHTRFARIDTLSLSSTLSVASFSLPQFRYLSNSLAGFCYLKSGSFFICGGKDDRAAYDEGFLCNLRSGEVRELAPMSTGRYAHGVVQVGTFVYSFGGGNNPWVGSAVNTCERFDLNHASWVSLPHMLSRRMMTCPSKHHKKIYLIGGCWTNKSEVYDTRIGVFLPLDVSSPHTGACCSVITSGSLLLLSPSGVWEWKIDTKEDMRQVVKYEEGDGELPFFFSSPVRYREFIYVHGDDQSIYRFSLPNNNFYIVAEPGELPRCEEELDEEESDEVLQPQFAFE